LWVDVGCPQKKNYPIDIKKAFGIDSNVIFFCGHPDLILDGNYRAPVTIFEN